MPTMSHTPEQRAAWHNSKRRTYETIADCRRRNLRAGTYLTAYTDPAHKHGITYARNLPVHVGTYGAIAYLLRR